MASGLKTKKLLIGGMTCIHCQDKIQKKLLSTAGIQKAEVSYSAGTAVITYDTDLISLKEVISVIQKLDYEVLADRRQTADSKRTAGILIMILALFLLLRQSGLSGIFNAFPTAETKMGYGMLFLIGLATSVHCLAMCGGINLSQCIPRAAEDLPQGPLKVLRPSFLYNLGRVISYTAVGGIVGALGSVVAFSGSFRGVVQIVAGVFMAIMGLNMLGLFPALRRLNPHIPKAIAQKVDQRRGRSNSPFYVGLLNGLMPCGPLQAMQLYALSAGSPLKGALSMLIFSLGTVPLMFGLGAFSSVLSKRFTKKVMASGAVLVAVLGLSMFSQGLSLSGLALPSFAFGSAEDSGDRPGIVVEDGVQIVNSTLSSRRYPAITVEAGKPVKWIIDAPKGSINGCNNRITIREYGIEHRFTEGENVIEFLPAETGTFPYSCWMGMIRSSITVVEAGAEIAAANTPKKPVPANFTIPTDKLAVAAPVSRQEGNYQQVAIELTDDGFDPAVVVVQAGLETEWIINNHSSLNANSILLVPAYNTQLFLEPSENPLYLYPAESFDFSNGNSSFFGYVKVVEDVGRIDADQIKEEAGNHQPLIWPPETFDSGGESPSCCN